MLATVLAIIAILLSLASLAWQVVSWRRSGAVVSVTATQTLPLYGNRNQPGDWHVDVTARNSGRSPITVNSWGLRMPNGQTMVMPGNLSWSASLPHRPEPGANASWFIATEDVKRTCAEHGVRYQDLVAYVKLADGRTINAGERGIGLE